ncbi:hypothetical protein [Enterococcus hailinensis]|uniref:hypothetical protein n=1 Tax=Enterococcus hailinensis TaxID=3238988 RepID=UPI0038B412CB
MRGVTRYKSGWKVFYQNKGMKKWKCFPTEHEAEEYRIYLENKYGVPKREQSEPEDFAGQVIGYWKIIGDTGKRTSGRSQIILARHVETGKIKEMPLKSLKASGDKAGIYQTKKGSKNKFQKNLSKQYIRGTNVNVIGKKNSKNKTGYVGVSFDNQRKRWYAQIKINNGKTKGLGRFTNFKEAVLKRNKTEIELRKELYDSIGKEIFALSESDIDINDYVKEKQKEIDEHIRNNQKPILEKYKKENPDE